MNYRKKTKIAVLITIILAVAITGGAFAVEAQSSFEIGVFANNIEQDARKSQKISEWEVSKSINDNLCAMLFYNDTQDDHTFSIYVKGNGLRFGYFFRIGGGSSMIAEGVDEFTFDGKGSAILSMNKCKVAIIELDNGNAISTIEIDPSKPFAVVIPYNSGSVTLYDDNGNTINVNEYNQPDDMNVLTPQIILHEYDGNPDLTFGKTLTKEETGWVRLTGMVFIEVKVPDGAMTVQTYYAEAGTEVTPHRMLDNKYSAPYKNPSVLSNDFLTGNSFNIADYYPDGFLGYIWAVITDADGAEHKSEFINAIYEPDSPDTTISPSNDNPTGTHKYEVRASLHEGMPEYRFAATGITNVTDEWSYGYVLELDVFDENNNLILSEDFSEVLDGETIGYYVYNHMMDTMGLHVVDVNFDGYKDVIILNTFAGAHGNTWYDCWLWDVNTSSFIISKTFTEICNPALDPEKECIYSAGGSGAGYWGGNIYKFINGEFVLTNELYTDMNGLAERELMNGEMQIVREVSYGDDEQVAKAEQDYYKTSDLWQLDNPRWYWVGGHHADQWLGG